MPVTVYNLLGQVVATLVNETEPVGENEVLWYAADCASGLYVCRLEAVSAADPSVRFASVKKMILLR
ncbi:MAG TPA: hypothetical protein VMW43_05350 [Bacteroidota bacterium]|nr:hypothetical protein [Bacteroidota bacterium]